MTLTEMSYYGRRMMPLVIIAILVLLIFYFAFQLLFMYLRGQQITNQAQNKPKVEVKATFNKIKKPIFNDATPSDTIKNYVMDTIDGSPIDATKSAQVYFIPKKSPSFGFLQKIYFMAQKVGIDSTITKHKLTDERTAAFYDGLHALTIDISNFNFNYQYTISQDNIKLKTGTGIDKGTIQNSATDFIREIGRYPEELARGERHVDYFNLNIETKELTPVKTVEEANMAEVGFFRPKTNGADIVAPKYYNSPHFVVIAFTEDGLKVVRAQVMLFEKSNEQVGIYPLKTGEAAWEELKAGKGFIVSNSPTAPTDNVNIKSMSLAYLDYEDYQEYFQPVFVFIGENNFVGYVPAVVDEYMAP